MQQQSVSVARVHHSVLAGPERRLLRWLATRMPDWVTPDHLTLLGVGGALLCGVCHAATSASPLLLWGAGLGLLVNWFGDSLDGTLARHRRAERPRYGFFLDHSTDVVSQVLIFAGLGLSPYMRLDAACLGLMSYWLAALHSFIRAIATGIFQISYGGVGPTELRLGLMAYDLLLLLGPALPRTGGAGASPIDLFCAAMFVVVFASFIVLTVRQARRLAALERTAGAPDAAVAGRT